jgi:hypothetical protein
MKALAASALALLIITIPFELRLYWPGATVTASTPFDIVMWVYCAAFAAAFWLCFAKTMSWALGFALGAAAGFGLPFLSGVPDGWLTAFGAKVGLDQSSFGVIAALVLPFCLALSLYTAALSGLLARAVHHQQHTRALDARELILLVLAVGAAGIFLALYVLHRALPYAIDHWSLPPAERMDRLLAGVVLSSLTVILIIARRVARRIWLGLVVVGKVSGWVLEPNGQHATLDSAPPFHSSLRGQYSRLLFHDQPGAARKLVGRVA